MTSAHTMMTWTEQQSRGVPLLLCTAAACMSLSEPAVPVCLGADVLRAWRCCTLEGALLGASSLRKFVAVGGPLSERRL